MKTLFSILNGAFTVTEDGGNVTLSINESANVGGGAAAGIIALQGSGSVVLKGKLAFDLGLKVAEADSPSAIVPLEVAAGAVVDSAIGSL